MSDDIALIAMKDEPPLTQGAPVGKADSDSAEELLTTLCAIHSSLPEQLLSQNQTLASLELPLAVLVEDDPPPEHHSWKRISARPLPSPNIRRDFYTGEIFIERQSGFRLRASDIDQAKAIRCVECEQFELDLEGLEIDEPADSRQKFYLQCYACCNFSVRNIKARNGRNLGLFEDCTRFAITDVTCEAYEGYGIIVLHSRLFEIHRCRFANNLAAGVMIVGDCRDGWITHSEFVGSRGYYNWDAGLHLCHCSRRIIAAQVPELCHEPLPIRMKTMRPRRIRIRNNRFANNRAQGIYVEGARECLIDSNVISENNKEGLCLDWGTALCVVHKNLISGNGYRANMAESEISADFITDFPLMTDGSSTCKLPGVSIDNGGLNAIIANEIRDNFGGGVKTVRAAVGNLVTENSFTSNDRGANFFVQKMHDVLILSMGNRTGEFDEGGTDLLDFNASSFNTIARNKFAAEGAEAIHYLHEHNRIYDNSFGSIDVASLSGLSSEVTEPSALGSHGSPIHPRNTAPEIAAHTLFSFGSVTGKQHGVIRLNPSGTIDFSPHPNESYWQQDADRLLFFDRRFRVSTAFQTFRAPDGSHLFLGRFQNSSVLHYLIPLASTAGTPSNPVLPPLCLVPPLVAPAERFLRAFFGRIGWSDTGFLCTRNAISNREGPQGNKLPCDLAQILSILGPGQSLVADVTSVPPDRTLLSDYLCVIGIFDLRAVLAANFEKRRAACSQAPTQPHPNWIYLSDRRDQFIAYLSTSGRGGAVDDIANLTAWLDSECIVSCPIEALIASTVPTPLVHRLSAFGVAEDSLNQELTSSLQSDAADMLTALPVWQDYWTDTAERIFCERGLPGINQRLGYQ